MKVIHRGAVALLATLVLILAAGCAGNSASADTVRVGLSSKSPTMLALFAALKNGYFAEEGLHVPEPTILPSGARLAAAVVGGSIDVGIGVTPDVFNLHQSGEPVKIIGAVYNSYYVDVVAGNGITAANSADLSTKIRSLIGKKIGITGPGSGTEALVTYLFRTVGADAKTDAELVSLGSDPSAAINALRSGQVDAVSHILSIGQQAELDGVGRIFISPGRGDIPALQGVVHGVAFALQPTIDGHRGELVKFLRGLHRGMQYIHADPADARQVLADLLTGMSPAVIDALMPPITANAATSLNVDPRGYQAESDMLTKSGLAPGGAPPLNDIVSADLIATAGGT